LNLTDLLICRGKSSDKNSSSSSNNNNINNNNSLKNFVYGENKKNFKFSYKNILTNFLNKNNNNNNNTNIKIGTNILIWQDEKDNKNNKVHTEYLIINIDYNLLIINPIDFECVKYYNFKYNN
jgi:hypothetical protein